jgi:Spy/CpxP family protein refolding chaperone
MKLSCLSLIAAAVMGTLAACITTASALDATSNARAARGHTQSKHRTQAVAAELNLTADQRQQLKPILQDQAQKLKALRGDTGLNRAQKRARLQAIRQDLLARIKPILTPEQFAQWLKLRAAGHNRRVPQ